MGDHDLAISLLHRKFMHGTKTTVCIKRKMTCSLPGLERTSLLSQWKEKNNVYYICIREKKCLLYMYDTS